MFSTLRQGGLLGSRTAAQSDSCSMALAEYRLNVLRQLPPEAQGDMLADAIPHAHSDELAGLCSAVIGLKHARALAAVIGRSSELPAELRSAVARADPMAEACQLAARLNGGWTGVVQVVADRRDPALLHFLGHPLTHGPADLAAKAADAMLDLTCVTIGRTGRCDAQPSDLARLDLALAAAARGWREHRSDPILIAGALLLGRRTPRLNEVLIESDHPFTIALRNVAERVHHQIVRRNLIRWLGEPALDRSVTRWMQNVTAADAFGEVLHDGHLLLAPHRRRALKMLDRPTRCAPELSAATNLPARAQAHLATLLMRLDLSSRVRVQRLADCVAIGSPVARWRAALALESIPHRDAEMAAEQFAFDRAQFVARAAANRVFAKSDEIRRQFAGPRVGVSERVMDRLARSAHAPAVRRAVDRLARRGVDELLLRRRRMTIERLRAAAARMVARDPELFVQQLERALVEREGDDQLACIMLARRMQLCHEIEPALIELTDSNDARVASAAVAALGGRGTDLRLDALQHALDHQLPRVCANAIESIARAFPQRIEIEIMPRITMRDNRARANAVRAALRAMPDRGDEALIHMLGDADPLHRISAIWAARTGRARSASPVLHRIAESDHFPEVRTRARAAQRLLGVQIDPEMHPLPMQQ